MWVCALKAKHDVILEWMKKIYMYIWKLYICIYGNMYAYIYICIYGNYLTIKKKERMPFAATWMDLEIMTLSEVSQREKPYNLHVQYKIWHRWTYPRNRNRLTDTESRLVAAKAERSGWGLDWEFGINRCKLLYIKGVNQKVYNV